MKILIVKTSSLGDIIHAFPVLSYLHHRFPQAQIDWVVEQPFAELVQAHPYVHRAICVHTKQWRGALFSRSHLRQMHSFRQSLRQDDYDVAFDLQSNIKSGLIMLQTRAKVKVGYGWKTAHEWPNAFFTNHHFNPPSGLNIRDDILFLVQRYFEDCSSYEAPGVLLGISPDQEKKLETLLKASVLQNKPKVMVCPGSAWPNKQMTLEALERLLDNLQKDLKCAFLLVWGSKEEQQFVQRLQTRFSQDSIIVDKLSLPVLQNLMERTNLVVAMDSLPLHLAGTTSTSTLSVFGASLAQKFKPKGEKHFAFQGACPYGKTFPKRCPILRTCSTGSCIRSLSGQEVSDVFFHRTPRV
jgi:heptosyltransferase-1